MRLYLDENTMNRDLVQALRSRGIDVQTTGDMESQVEFLSTWS